MVLEEESVEALEVGDDRRISFLAGRTESKMVPYFNELFRRIEEECEPVSVVLESLGLNPRSDYLTFYHFRRRCVRWGVWVSGSEFAEFYRSKFFDPAAVSHWRELVGYLTKGLVPDLAGSWRRSAIVRGGSRLATARSGNRNRLRRIPLENWVRQGFGPTEIFRFLRPFFTDLTWYQVYRQVREVRARFGSESLVSGKSSRSVREVPVAGAGAVVSRESGRLAERLESESATGVPRERCVLVGATASMRAAGDGVDGLESGRNELLKHFGDLPRGGTVDEFLSSPGGAKLRSGAFWRSVAEAAGADFSGNIEFAGLNVGVGPGGLGNLLAWCESFSLALTSALGFANRPYAGALCHHPKYKSFHPWFSVLGHLFRTVWGIEPGGRRDELHSYFARSRLAIRFPNDGGAAEIGSLEEALCLYLVHSSLANAVPEFLVISLASEWKNGASRIYLGAGANSRWRTLNYNVLFTDYAKAVFSTEPGDLEREVKRQLFKPGVF